MKNMDDYHDHYLKKDVLLLAYVFEKFTDTCLKFYGKGLNGGVSYIAQRYAKANNKYMKNYNPKIPSKFIIYLDMNNL